MNVFLIICCIVVTVMVLLGNIYVLIYFQHEEDKNLAIFPKVVVVTGLTLACLCVLMLPLDVTNARTYGGLAMADLWQAVYIMIAVLCIFVIPFSLFYYEAEDPDSNKGQFCTALKYEAITVVVAVIVFVIMYTLLGWVRLPVMRYDQPAIMLELEEAVKLTCPGDHCGGTLNVMQIRATPPVYIMAMISFIGWFFFVLFGGIGLAALPLDLIQDWRNRPKRINLADYAYQKNRLNERANKLIEIGKSKDWGNSKSRANKRTFNKFKQAVYFLEKDWEIVKLQYKQQGGNPLMPWIWLFVGAICMLLSILWIVHVAVFVFPDPPYDLFLNNYFMALDNFFGLFGVLTYGIFAFYLLWCVIKGCMKFGLRFLFFQIHPMAIGGTMMNSFLFNVSIFLICSVSVVQFCTTAFSVYARLTAIDMIFGTQVQNLIFLEFFFQNNVFLYALVGLFAISLLYLIIFPKEKRDLADSLGDD